LLQERVILGIDPGTLVMGYGVIELGKQQIRVLQYGVIDLTGYEHYALKLHQIFAHTLKLIDEFCPDEVALEAPFYGKNVQTMLKLGRAQGVAMAAALAREVPITEYAPRKIKQAVTGNGNASKEQVAHMLMSSLQFYKIPKQLDASDALAVAVCHAYQGKARAISTTTWKQRIQANPGLLYQAKRVSNK